jgi:pSer/pThr/pTyr-binding forkhead associated (FHA) protein
MATLKIITGGRENGEQTYELSDELTTLGRAAECTIRMDHPSVSGKHCAISKIGNRYTLRDLDSTNGTRLNGQSIREFRLRPGDLISLGDAKVRFEGDDVDVSGIPSVRTATASERIVRGAGDGTTVSCPFGKRQDTRKAWCIALAVIGASALSALTWFLFRLFRS